MNRAWIPVFTAVAVVTLAFVSRTPKAQAASVGACFSSSAAIVRTMMSENMHTYAIATSVDKKGHPGALEVFSDAQGYTGYVLSSDEPFGSDKIYAPDHPMCIDQVIKNVGLYDANQPGVPTEAKLAEDPAVIKQECQLLGDDCLDHNLALENISSSEDAHVMIQATIVQSKFNHGNRSPGDIFTLVGRVSQEPLVIGNINIMHPGIVDYSTPEGALLVEETTVDTAYGNWAINRLNH